MIDISAKIDPVISDIYSRMNTICNDNGIRFYVVGASARDMILYYAYGIEAKRGTEDIDLGIQVTNWAELERVKAGLFASGYFRATGGDQTIRYENREGVSIPIDIIPFGSIADSGNEVSWPPDYRMQMNVIGFDDVYKAALSVRITSDPELDIRVASPAGIAALKVFAWFDRSPGAKRAPGDTRDAIDLAFLMRVYFDAGKYQSLSDEDADLLEQDDFDYVQSSARLLGRDAARLLGNNTRQQLVGILNDQTGDKDRYRLIEDMSSGQFGESFEMNFQLLASFALGVNDIIAGKTSEK